MCGIAGIIARQAPDLGDDLINMLKELVHRGRDATGLAVYELRDDSQVRVALTASRFEQDLQEIIESTPASRIHGSTKEKVSSPFTKPPWT